MSPEDFNFEIPDFNFDGADSVPTFIPDTVEEIVEEWRKTDEVRAAEKELEESLKKKAEAQKEIDEVSDELIALERKMQALRNKQFQLRGTLNHVETPIRRAEQVINIARENWEKKKAEQETLAAIRGLDTEQFAWGKGVEINGKTAKIMKHQTLAAEIIAAHKNIILADEMGVGKTLSMIAAMDYSKSKRVLVITPADVTSNFLSEIRMWAPHRHSVDMRGMSKAERTAVFSALEYLDNFVIVTNYEAWRKDESVLMHLAGLGLEQIFMDEAHVFKGAKTDTFRGVHFLCTTNNQCANCETILSEDRIGNRYPCQSCGTLDKRSSVVSIVPATGTPILNNPADVFTMLHLIDPDNFYNQTDFLRNFAEQDMYTGNWIFKAGGEKSLLTQLGFRFLRRTMNDVGIELPQQQVIHHELSMETYHDQLQAYNELTKFGEILLGGYDEEGRPRKLSTTSVLAQITRQRQCVVWPAGIKVLDPETGAVIASVGDKVQESVKVDKAISIIEEAWARDERVVVFSQFATGLEELQKRLDNHPANIRAVRFDGSTNLKTRDEVKTNFNAARGEEAKWDVVLANYKTGGVGLNLTACTTMIFLDMEWNPGKENQAIRRIHRIGQEKKTFVHILDVAGSVDTWMRNLIKNKQEILDGFNTQQKSLQEQYLEGIAQGEI